MVKNNIKNTKKSPIKSPSKKTSKIKSPVKLPNKKKSPIKSPIKRKSKINNKKLSNKIKLQTGGGKYIFFPGYSCSEGGAFDETELETNLKKYKTQSELTRESPAYSDFKGCKDIFDIFFEDIDETKLKLKYIQKSQSEDDPLNFIIYNMREELYIHTYDVSHLEADFKADYNELNLDDMFDFTTRPNCCNCISTVIYSNDIKNIDRTCMYLAHALTTANTISEKLPDWILRLYLDISVLEQLKYFNNLPKTPENIIDLTTLPSMFNDNSYIKASLEADNEYYRKVNAEARGPLYKEDILRMLFMAILNNKNTEIFISINDIIKKRLEPEITTSNFKMIYRFFPFIDEKVNICASRDADGV